MTRFLGRYSDFLYGLLRIVAGILFASHGAQKLFGALGGERAGAPLYQVAGVIEFFGGVLIALGLFTSVAAFICSGQMAFAYFMAHANKAFWPIQNGGELSMLYCFLFLYMASRGSGALALDRAFRRSAPPVRAAGHA